MQDMRANIASQAGTGDYILLLTPPPFAGIQIPLHYAGTHGGE